ncbi:hypothetical protein Hanom_Chr17g01543761 [Helianthus anomalus]
MFPAGSRRRGPLCSAIHHIATMSRLATLFAIAVAMAAIDNYDAELVEPSRIL